MRANAHQGQTQIVIIGGGFAGVFCARYLEKYLRRDPRGQITLVNRENSFVYQPPTAQHAIRQARRVAVNIVAALRGQALQPFAYRMRAQLVSLGHQTAAAEIIGFTLCGCFAWWLWRTLYLLKLPGLVRKLRVALDWTIALLFPRDIVQMYEHQALHSASP